MATLKEFRRFASSESGMDTCKPYLHRRAYGYDYDPRRHGIVFISLYSHLLSGGCILFLE